MNWFGWSLSAPGIVRVCNYNLIHVRENPNLRWHANFRNFMREQSVGLIGRFRVTKWIAERQGGIGVASGLSYDIANVGSDVRALCVIRDKSRAEKNLCGSQCGVRSGISEVGGKVERQPVCRALRLALASAGSSIAANIAMMAITTSSSMRVKPRLPGGFQNGHLFAPRSFIGGLNAFDIFFHALYGICKVWC